MTNIYLFYGLYDQIPAHLYITIYSVPSQSIALEKGCYIKGDVGASLPNNKVKRANGYIEGNRHNTAPQYSAGIGYNATNNLRLDIAFSYIGDLKYSGKLITPLGQTITQNENTKADMLLLNAYYHFFEDKSPPAFALSPFIGAGVGVAKIRHSDVSITSSSSSVGKILIRRPASTNIAFNVITGVSTYLTHNFIAEWSYKYAYLGNFKNGTANSYVNSASSATPLQLKKYKLSTHSLAVGLRYNF